MANDSLIENYVNALCREIEQTNLNQEISSIYIGGGTPSILKINQFKRIFKSLHKVFNLGHCNEVTVEANPGTINENLLHDLRSLGVNRLSIGVQSFDDNLLRIIGRIHDSNKAIEAINMAKSIFENVSIDLMYDLPHQTLKILNKTIAMAITLEIKHISIYGLEIEEGTEFGRLLELGKLKLPNDDESEAMYEFITDGLPRHGFNRYEISNFAKLGFESQHNLGYWSDVNYIGFGAAAHSYINNMRYSNVLNVADYINRINSNCEVKQIEEVVTRERAMEEFCFLSLRKAEGINLKNFQLKFGESIESIYFKTIKKLTQQGLIDVDSEHIRLTKRGMKYGNLAFAEFLLNYD